MRPYELINRLLIGFHLLALTLVGQSEKSVRSFLKYSDLTAQIIHTDGMTRTELLERILVAKKCSFRCVSLFLSLSHTHTHRCERTWDFSLLILTTFQHARAQQIMSEPTVNNNQIVILLMQLAMMVATTMLPVCTKCSNNQCASQFVDSFYVRLCVVNSRMAHYVNALYVEFEGSNCTWLPYACTQLIYLIMRTLQWQSSLHVI